MVLMDGLFDGVIGLLYVFGNCLFDGLLCLFGNGLFCGYIDYFFFFSLLTFCIFVCFVCCVLFNLILYVFILRNIFIKLVSEATRSLSFNLQTIIVETICRNDNCAKTFLYHYLNYRF